MGDQATVKPKLSKRAKAAFEAALKGRAVNFQGWPIKEIVALLEHTLSYIAFAKVRLEEEIRERQACLDELRQREAELLESRNELLADLRQGGG